MNSYENKKFHDEQGIFHYETNVAFSLCGQNRALHLHELLKLTSDAAVEDFNLRGMSSEFLAKKNFAILIARNSFRFFRAPVENEQIQILTWEEPPEPLQFRRIYEIKNSLGEKLITGESIWLLVDLALRRILPTKKFTLREAPTQRRGTDCIPCGKISTAEIEDQMILIGERKICRSDLDANGHTNNSRYAAFITDFLPENFAKKLLKDFRINYSKEAILDENLKLFALINDQKATIIGKTENATSFESELFW